jgi:hypothetical protein
MAQFCRRSYSAILGVAAVTLVLLTLLGPRPGAAESSAHAVQVVDAFNAARAKRDLSAVAVLLHANATIVDEKHDLTTGTEDLYRLLPLSERFELSPRHVTDVSMVAWTETVEPNAHPSWESNPNWWLDDVQAARLSDRRVLWSGRNRHPRRGQPGTSAPCERMLSGRESCSWLSGRRTHNQEVTWSTALTRSAPTLRCWSQASRYWEVWRSGCVQAAASRLERSPVAESSAASQRG